jgi:hypothetical protein
MPGCRQVFIIERKTRQILDPRRIGKSADRLHVRTLLQLLNPPQPGHEPIAIDVDRHGSYDPQFAIPAGHAMGDRLAAIEQTAIVVCEGYGWLEERERVDAWHSREDLECKEC